MSNAKKILIIDDDDLFSGALSSALKQANYETVTCPDAQGALSIFDIDKFDLVVSDIRLPGSLSGVDLLQKFKDSHPTSFFVLMTGFSELSETFEAYKYKPDGFLAKPFKKEDLFAIITALFQPMGGGDSSAVQEQFDDDFCKINIDDFVSGKSIQADVYIRIQENKFVKIAHAGENIPLDRIKAYKQKNIFFLYLKQEDFKKYVDLSLTLTPLVFKNSAINREKKLNFLKHATDVIQTEIKLKGVNEETFAHASTVLENSLNLLSENSSLLAMLQGLNTHADHLFAHNLAVSLYSCMIAKKLGWHSLNTLFKLSLGGLLHDIGKKEIDAHIPDKPRREFTKAEVDIYESHPMRGMEIVSTIQGIPSDVIQIIGQHHENCLGVGYPMKISKMKIHPMAKVVAVANEFAKWTVKNPNCTTPLDPKKAIDQILMFSNRFDGKALNALMACFGMKGAIEV